MGSCLCITIACHAWLLPYAILSHLERCVLPSLVPVLFWGDTPPHSTTGEARSHWILLCWGREFFLQHPFEEGGTFVAPYATRSLLSNHRFCPPSLPTLCVLVLTASAHLPPSSQLEPAGVMGDLGWYSIRFSLWAFGYVWPVAVAAATHLQTEEGVPTDMSATLFFPPSTSSHSALRDPRPGAAPFVAGSAGSVSSSGAAAGDSSAAPAPRTATFHVSFHCARRQLAEVVGTHGRLTLHDFVNPASPESATFQVEVDGRSLPPGSKVWWIRSSMLLLALSHPLPPVVAGKTWARHCRGEGLHARGEHDDPHEQARSGREERTVLAWCSPNDPSRVRCMSEECSCWRCACCRGPMHSALRSVGRAQRVSHARELGRTGWRAGASRVESWGEQGGELGGVGWRAGANRVESWGE
jgi:hypothetical protein